MKLLLLGGTRFLGRHVAEQALAAGHQVTLLHRGRSGPAMFPQAEHRIADRDGDLAALQDGQWDAAIDTSAYFPRQVRSIAAVLQRRVAHYQLVSSISVYAAFDKPGLAEDAPVKLLADPDVQVVDGQTYGGLKVLCEQAAAQGFGGDRCLVSRPGLLVGPHDPTGRFTWWLQRAKRGGEMLAPGDPAAPVQWIDARDAAAWMLLQAARGTTGVFNLTGPGSPCTLGELLGTACSALDGGATLSWVDQDFLLEHGVAPWTELPLWLPQASAGLHQVNIGRALANGLRCRPLAETIDDTAAWASSDRFAGGPVPSGDGLPRPAVGLAAERERALLQAWHTRRGGH